MIRHRALPVTGLLVGVLLLAACGGDADTTTSSGVGAGPSSPTPAAQSDFNDADVAFATGMKPHHAQAVEMSDMVLAADPVPEVAALAERVKAAQAPEIEELDEMIEHFGAEEVSGGGHGAHGGGMGGAGMHSGMMTDEQMRGLRAAPRADVSRMWLTMMIEHHEGAIEAAETELADGIYPPARDLAARIKADQEAEIAEMKELLTRL